ncbi:carboxypeptidase-like regulatory domain-containing protein [Variovorax sp.]|uniref:carboxypeptidase-like regulatory domain-containing protein n=1 Tax=Variovorax sp. TaxID=1871043 RepID=UPI003BACF06D
MQKYQNNIADRSGNAVAGVQVSVTLVGGGLATIYSDNGSTVTANPLTTDANGYFEFYAPDGRYNINAAGKGGYSDVLIADTVVLAEQTETYRNQAQTFATNAGTSAGAASTAKAGAEAAAAIAVPAATNASTAATQASAAAADAGVARDTALALQNFYQDTPAALSNGVAAVGSLVAGSGGTNGTFALGFTGGAGSGATGQFIVSGGSVSQVVMTSRGFGYTSAPTVSFSASAGLSGASAVAVISQNMTAGQRFSTPSDVAGETAIIWENVANVAVEKDRVASAKQLTDPDWAGIWNGWPDPFFRHMEIGDSLNGRERWFLFGGGAADDISLVPNPIYKGSRAMRRRADAGADRLAGEWIYLDEVDCAPGDRVTIRGLLVGDSPLVSFALRAVDAAGGFLGAQEQADVVATLQGALASVTFTLPASSAKIAIYPFTLTAGKDFRLAGLWVYKGEAVDGPARPNLPDDTFFALKLAEQSSSDPDVPPVTLPPYIYAVQGRQCNVYTANLHGDDDTQYNHRFVSGYGQQLNECWRWTPSGAVTDAAFAVRVNHKRTGAQLASKSALLRAAASTAGIGQTVSLMLVGDSTARSEVNGEEGVLGQTLLDIAAADSMGLTLIGSHGPTPQNRHEGRGGFTVLDYTTAGRTYRKFNVSGVSQTPAINSAEYTNSGTRYRVQETALSGGAGSITFSIESGPDTPSGSGTLTKVNDGAGDATIAFSSTATVPGNPFWVGGQLDVPQYLATMGFAVPDWFFVLLWINDVNGLMSDEAVDALAAARLPMFDNLLDSMRHCGPSVRVAIAIPSIASLYQDSFGNSDATQTLWRYRMNITRITALLIDRYRDRHGDRIYLLSDCTSNDAVNNAAYYDPQPANSRSTVLVQRQKDSVHNAKTGYQQKADSQWSFLKFYAS